MNIQTIVHQLEKTYPGARIVKNPDQNPTEILCEMDPTEKHPLYSTAVAVIDSIPAHFHKTTAEIYCVTKGTLTLFIEKERHILKEGEYVVIQPGQLHRAEGSETWVEVYSEPGWTKEDHYLATNVSIEPSIDSVYSIRLLTDNFETMFNFYADILKLPVESGTTAGPYAEFSFGAVKVSLFEKKHMFEALHLTDKKSTPQSCVLTFMVNDVDALEKKLRTLNVTILSGAKDFSTWKIRALHIADPEGNIIELHQNLITK